MSRKDSPLRSTARAAAWPFRRFFGPQFQWVRDQVVESDHRIQGRITAVDSRVAEATRQIDSLRSEIGALESVVTNRAESGAEALSQAGHELRSTADWLEAVRDETAALRSEMSQFVGDSGRRALREDAVREAVGASVDELDPAIADLLNYADGFRGFKAQSRLWFNEPVSITHRAGRVLVASINERIIEGPYVYRALASLPAGSRVLDVGGVESVTALSLASLGYKVTTIDLRQYPFEHPNLTGVASPLDDWSTEERFDAVICLSSIEHFGIGAYGEMKGPPDADRRAMRQLMGMMTPKGTLVLTVPFGSPGLAATERVYDRQGVDGLVVGWDVHDVTIAKRTSDLVWDVVDEATVFEPGDDGVALVTASAPEA